MSFEQIKQKYVSTFVQKQVDIQKAWDEVDLTELHHLLHKLTGSSGGYGFDDLCTYCRQATELTKSGELYSKKELDECLESIIELLHLESNKI